MRRKSLRSRRRISLNPETTPLSPDMADMKDQWPEIQMQQEEIENIDPLMIEHGQNDLMENLTGQNDVRLNDTLSREVGSDLSGDTHLHRVEPIFGGEGELPGVTVYGTMRSPETERTLLRLDDLSVPYRFIDIDDDPYAEEEVRRMNYGHAKIPTVVFGEEGSRILAEPSIEELDRGLHDYGFLT